MRIAIVGAGVAGSYCAYRLSRDAPDLAVELFEASERVGGRLWTTPLDGVAGSPAEIGGMFIGDKQENLVGLVKHELQLPCEQVAWERRHQYLRDEYLTDSSYTSGQRIPFKLAEGEVGMTPVSLLVHALEQISPGLMGMWPIDRASPDNSPEATIAHLRSVVRGKRHLWEWGFWNLLSEFVSNEAYNLLQSTIGSASMFRNANAYDAIWVFLHEASQEFSRITAGYQTLPETLVQRASKTCRVHMEHRLARVQRKKDRFHLHFETRSGGRVVEADQVILAMPRRSLELVDLDDKIIAPDDWRGLLDAVLPVPACKLFLAFDTPWWNASAIGPTTQKHDTIAASYTDLPMRQCYYFGAPLPDKPALLMATYADDVATSYWAGLVHPTFCQIRRAPAQGRSGLCTSIEMEDAAQRQLSAMHHDCQVPEPIDGLFFNWSDDPYGAAWHAWAPYQKSWKVIEQVRQPNPRLDLFICGEAFAQVQGWVEGALNNAELVLQRLGLPRPSWVRADYTFEHLEKETTMDNKLAAFLVDLGEDLKLQKAYKKDPRAVMTTYGLTKAEQRAMLSGDDAKILAATGPTSGVKLFKIIVRTEPKAAAKKPSKKPAKKAKPKAKK